MLKIKRVCFIPCEHYLALLYRSEPTYKQRTYTNPNIITGKWWLGTKNNVTGATNRNKGENIVVMTVVPILLGMLLYLNVSVEMTFLTSGQPVHQCTNLKNNKAAFESAWTHRGLQRKRQSALQNRSPVQVNVHFQMWKTPRGRKSKTSPRATRRKHHFWDSTSSPGWSILHDGDLIYRHASASAVAPPDPDHHPALRFITGDSCRIRHCVRYHKVWWASLSVRWDVHQFLSVIKYLKPRRHLN